MSEGFGKAVWTDGERYEGEWKKDKRNGKGKATYSDGSTYVGECNMPVSIHTLETSNDFWLVA